VGHNFQGKSRFAAKGVLLQKAGLEEKKETFFWKKEAGESER